MKDTRILLYLGLFFTFHAAAAELVPVVASVNERQKALGEYYKAVKTSGNASEAVKQNLYKNIVQPKDTQLTQTMTNQLEGLMKEKSIQRKLTSDPVDEAEEWDDGTPAESSETGSKSLGATQSGGGPKISAPKKEAVAIDGSNIPAEIEFAPNHQSKTGAVRGPADLAPGEVQFKGRTKKPNKK